MFKLKNGQVVVLEDGFYLFTTKEVLKNFVEDDFFINYVCMITRSGVKEFVTQLEHTYYKPLTDRNNLFIVHILMWQDIPWFIISIPFEEKHLANDVLSSCGLRVTDGTPTVITASGIEQFPIFGENVFTLENTPEHPIYKNDENTNKAMREMEKEAIDRITGKKNKHNQ